MSNNQRRIKQVTLLKQELMMFRAHLLRDLAGIGKFAGIT